jgi:hypothetical protein
MPENHQIPVSKACPSCGGIRYRSVRPSGWMAFTKDRVCSDCQIQYTPPTPLWAAIVFIVAGLIPLLLGMFGIIATVIVEHDQGKNMNATPLFVMGGLTVLGVFAIAHGIRTLLGRKPN